MAIERLEGLLGPIAGGRQSVGSQSDPGEKGDERQFVKDTLIRKVTRLPDQDRFQPAADAKIIHTATPARIHCRAPREQLFQLGEPDARGRHGAEGSPFQMPTRLADGLGLESGLSALACAFRPIPRTLCPWCSVPPRPLSGTRAGLGGWSRAKHKQNQVSNLGGGTPGDGQFMLHDCLNLGPAGVYIFLTRLASQLITARRCSGPVSMHDT